MLRRKIQEFGITYKRKRKSQEEIQFEKLSWVERQLQLIQNFIKVNETFKTRDIINLLGDVTKKTTIIRLNELIQAGEIIRLSRGIYRRKS